MTTSPLTMPRKANRRPPAKAWDGSRREAGSPRSDGTREDRVGVRPIRGESSSEASSIVLRIAADHAAEFERLFEAEEVPIWDDFTRRGRFLEASLVRAIGGSEQRGGIQDYLLHIVAADHEAHEEHDRDPRFRAFLAKAERLQPHPALVWFGHTLFERRT